VDALRNLNAKHGCTERAPDYSRVEIAPLSDMSCIVIKKRCARRELYG
jgi:hypothetical protein